MSWRVRFPANYRARYYNATLQRFISEDPIGLKGGDANFYAYVGNDPVQLTDPLGLSTGQVGITVAYTFPWGGSGQFFAGFAFDNHGGFGTYWGGGAGLGGGTKVTGGAGYDYSNGSSICDLRGPFTDYSLGGGDGLAGNVHVFQGSSPHGLVTGGGGSVGFGAGGAGSAGGTYTFVNPLVGRNCGCK
jgi:hypothetical protein